MQNNYYTYRVDVDEECFYVGMGKGDRLNHCLSGTSHNYELNKLHFTARSDNIKCYKVDDGLSKQLAMAKEKELIIKLRPEANKSLRNILVEEVSFEGKTLSSVMGCRRLKAFILNNISVINSTKLNKCEFTITEQNVHKHLELVNKAFESSIVRYKPTKGSIAICSLDKDTSVIKGKGFTQNVNKIVIDNYEDSLTGEPVGLCLVPYYISHKASLNRLEYLPKYYSKDETNLYLLVSCLLKVLNGDNHVNILVVDNHLRSLLVDWLST